MRYPKDHGQQTRRRIVENASYGLRENGADSLSVVDLMKLVDLTHGSFYAYFKSRDALVVEALAFAMDRTVDHWMDLTEGLPAGKGFDAVVESYLSSRHRNNPARGCALPALAADIGRSGPEDRCHRPFGPEEIVNGRAAGRSRRNCDHGRLHRTCACGRRQAAV
jgi:TetR/AcrR family transcriptional repressor of nem operon